MLHRTQIRAVGCTVCCLATVETVAVGGCLGWQLAPGSGVLTGVDVLLGLVSETLSFWLCLCLCLWVQWLRHRSRLAALRRSRRTIPRTRNKCLNSPDHIIRIRDIGWQLIVDLTLEVLLQPVSNLDR